jgi:hypothetical protein
MMSAALRKDPFDCPVDLFPENSVLRLAEAIDRCGSKGVVFGASVGIDSFVMASLCLRARGKTPKWQVVALQMNDARIRGESYNTELYEAIGADIIQTDVTGEAIDTEKGLGIPPRWMRACLMKLVLRWLPGRARQKVILSVKAGQAPGWILIHYQPPLSCIACGSPGSGNMPEAIDLWF